MAFPISANDGAAAAKGKARSEQGGAGQWEGDAAGVWEDLQSCQNAHNWQWLLLCLSNTAAFFPLLFPRPARALPAPPFPSVLIWQIPHYLWKAFASSAAVLPWS